MTSKSPVRTCDDMDEQALSYAEIKALCAGNPLIAEKMGLDVEVAKLKMLKASHQSQQYRLEDNLRLHFPKQIESSKLAIEGYKADITRLEVHTQRVEEGISPMKIGADSYTERKDAGTALVESCRKIKGIGPEKVGEYRGFEIHISFDTMSREYKCQLKGAMTHAVSLGADPSGNIIRIDNALDKIPVTMDKVETKLQSLYSQVENAKVELTKPFAQETELAEKSARLTELDTLLSLDGRDTPSEESREGDAQDADLQDVDSEEVEDMDVDGIKQGNNEDKNIDVGISDKVLAAKDNTSQLSGDETTPQVPHAPQQQYPQPAPSIPQAAAPLLSQPPQQTSTPTQYQGYPQGQQQGQALAQRRDGRGDEPKPRDGFSSGAAKTEDKKDERSSAQPPQDKIKKKSYDER